MKQYTIEEQNIKPIELKESILKNTTIPKINKEPQNKTQKKSKCKTKLDLKKRKTKYKTKTKTKPPKHQQENKKKY